MYSFFIVVGKFHHYQVLKYNYFLVKFFNSQEIKFRKVT